MTKTNSTQEESPPIAYCSFCRKSNLEAGPLAEGPELVFICYHCIRTCGQLVENEYARLGRELPSIDE